MTDGCGVPTSAGTGDCAAITDAGISTGAGIEQKTVTDHNGEFRFEAPVGTYELSFRHPAYYETTVKGVEIKKAPLSMLKITPPLSITSPQQILQRDPEIIGPKMVPAPKIVHSKEEK
jgi:hypothetical protein